jgi:hypothetical protein
MSYHKTYTRKRRKSFKGSMIHDFFFKCVEKIQVSVQSDKNKGHVTGANM